MKTYLRAGIASICVFAFMFFMSIPHGRTYAAIYALIPAIFTFALLRAEKITKLRLFFYFIYVFIFWFGFDLMAIHERGTLFLPVDMGNTTILPCPATIPMIISGWIAYGNDVFMQEVGGVIVRGPLVIYPTTYSMFLVVLTITLVQGVLLGKGWCGWTCPFGGVIEAFAAGNPKTAKWRMKRFMKEGNPLLGVKDKIRDFKWGFLIAICLLSVLLIGPVFCMICPSRVWNDWPNPAWSDFWFQAISIVLLFSIFWAACPILSRKKIWCNSICPVGAFFGLLGILSPFVVRIDGGKCRQCYQCVRGCKDYALTTESVRQGKPLFFECTKCGRCIDNCPEGAVDIYLRGTSIKARSVFIPLCMVFMFIWLSVFVWAIVTILPEMLGL